MQQLTEAKFPRTGKEYKLEKIDTGFNLRLIDLSKKIEPELFSFQEMLELSQSGQITFTGFEEKKNEAELILLNLIHQTEISSLQAQLQRSETEKTNKDGEILKLKDENNAFQSRIDELNDEIENQKSIIIDLQEAKEIVK